VQGHNRSRDELAEAAGTAVDVSADIVGVVRLEPGRIHGVPGDDPVPKAGREPFDLAFDHLRLIDV